MSRKIYELGPDAAAWYSTILDATVSALPSSIDDARALVEPIAGEVWMGSLALYGGTTAGRAVHSSRRVSDRTRAEVFRRDGFICTYCGGRAIPRCILVAISDVFPDEVPYYAHYRRGTVHPAYWALAPEADHVLAHAKGGSSDAANLTTLHAMCNTQKSSLDSGALPVVERPVHDDRWDGLLSRYADIVVAGETYGRRHAGPDYHPAWLRRFGRQTDDRLIG